MPSRGVVDSFRFGKGCGLDVLGIVLAPGGSDGIGVSRFYFNFGRAWMCLLEFLHV